MVSKTTSSVPLEIEAGHRVGLTVESLTSLPRRNNNLFLSEFLHRQRAYRGRYAQEGFAEIASWHRSESANLTLQTVHGEPSITQDESLLQTPILRARTNAAESRTAFTTDGLLRENSNAVVDKVQEKQRAPKVASAIPEKHLTLKPKKAGPNRGKKRNFDENKASDDDLQQRLKERRERKRARKNIMKPPDVDSETENLHRPAKIKAKKDGYKSRTPAGLALMHGFTATNIGKKRITIEPFLRKIGVFKKGKASRVSRVVTKTNRKQEQHDVCFSETRFLRGADMKAIENASSTSSSSSDNDETVLKRQTAYKTKGIDKRGRKSSKGSISSRGSDKNPTFDGNSKCRSYDPDDSIIWDIERDSYVEESETDGRQGTILLNFPGDALVRDKVTGQGTIVETPVNPEDCVLENHLSHGASDGLGPSQSVSQAVGRESPVQVEGKNSGCFSKYFGLPAVGYTPHNLTGSDTDKSLLSPVIAASWDGRPPVQDLNPFSQSSPLFGTCPGRTTFSDFTFLADETLGFYASSDNPRAIADDVTGLDNDFPLHAGVFPNSDSPVEIDMADDWDTRSLNCDLNHTLAAPLSTADNIYLDYDYGTNDRHLDRPVCFYELCTEPSDLEMGTGVSGAGDCPTLSDEQRDCYMNDEEAPENRVSPQLTEDLWDSPSGSMVQVDKFSQGRMMLNGFDHSTSSRFQGISNVEAEVARLFKQNHWLPHRL